LRSETINVYSGMPRQAVEAFLRFVYTGTLPVVDGLSADGYRTCSGTFCSLERGTACGGYL
jgi:hypothetical protein